MGSRSISPESRVTAATKPRASTSNSLASLRPRWRNHGAADDFLHQRVQMAGQLVEPMRQIVDRFQGPAHLAPVTHQLIEICHRLLRLGERLPQVVHRRRGIVEDAVDVLGVAGGEVGELLDVVEGLGQGQPVLLVEEALDAVDIRTMATRCCGIGKRAL